MNEQKKPNVVYILADDMGYGDVSGLNPDSVFKTPNLDGMIDGGLHFSDAHTSSSVCTPSRYSLLTGRYCWRTYLKRGVLWGTSGPLLEEGRTTLAHLAQRAGYRTACVGKWHLGWDWALKEREGGSISRDSRTSVELEDIDYWAPIAKGPTEFGFDRFYGISGSLDMPPYVYVENDLPVEEPTAWGSASEFVREGPRMASLRANNVLGHLTDRAVSVIEEGSEDQPFFLYFPITAPHTPISPAPEFDGISGVNPYVDFCLEVDARVGQIFDALERTGQLEDTLVIFTTDNGASAQPSECAMLEKRYGHRCSHIYRGYKSDIWDGGHRIPFLLHWPKGIQAGSRCDQSVGIFDFFATFAEMNDMELKDNEGPDSRSFLPAFRDDAIDASGRWALIHHSIDGRFAIRSGRWKLCRCPGSGGWSAPRDDEARRDGGWEVQLYDMEADPGENNNLARECPEQVLEMTKLLQRCIVEGRSTPGESVERLAGDALETWEQIDWLPKIPEVYVIDD